jgi:hypothetical protein
LRLTQRQLAIILDVGQQTISDWEAGTRRICWPIIVGLALDAIEARLRRDGLLPSSDDPRAIG